MTSRLSGRTALITGAASGLGAAIATRFASEGAQVIVSDLDQAKAQTHANTIGDAAIALELDVTCPKSWERAVTAASDRFGKLDILVNNAGICIPGSVEDLSLEDWHRTHSVDLDSVFLGVKAFLPLMVRTSTAHGGAILNISSISGIVAAGNMAAYNSAKAAVRHLTKSIALHCAKMRYGITCNSLHPTFIDTPLLDEFTAGRTREETLGKLARQIPVGRVGIPDDVAWAAVYLCSPEAIFITGAELAIDGGLSAM
ncbi:glucose 1-dehydrogenase [Novosphingobium sp. FGD1]|uniref:Glucose 1-dehydrogenase n=1 Tax=Novosphingobium silvae TaxID=2692619 RepID=A0A7X4GKB9_9SPHN|nr:glucose 1-dehydrogenase [Novosphingobium silvae]MYM00261.1 glucose 1-dehydrogenase [Novosphingobium silvae]